MEPDYRDPALHDALLSLMTAIGNMRVVDQETHDDAIVATVVGLSAFYLHTDAVTGQYHEDPIYLDRSRVVFGLLPGAVAPLIVLLERRSAEVGRAASRGELPASERLVWRHWTERLALYRAVLDAVVTESGLDAPSDRLWTHVTAPLLQGLYPADVDWQKLGISDPSTPQKPDVVTLATTAFVTALDYELVDNIQRWLLEWDATIDAYGEAVRDWLVSFYEVVADLADDLKKGAFSVGRVILIGGGVLLAGFAGYKFLTRKKPS